MTDEEVYEIGTLLAHLCGSIEGFDLMFMSEFTDEQINEALIRIAGAWSSNNPGEPQPFGFKFAELAAFTLIDLRQLVSGAIDQEFQQIITEGFQDDAG